MPATSPGAGGGPYSAVAAWARAMTNSISQNRARGVSLDYIVETGGVITDAVSTQKWPGEANVHVSIVNWIKDRTGYHRTMEYVQGRLEQLGFDDVRPAHMACDEDPCRILNVAVVLSAAQPIDQSPRARWR